jgi:hypothetical protein
LGGFLLVVKFSGTSNVDHRIGSAVLHASPITAPPSRPTVTESVALPPYRRDGRIQMVLALEINFAQWGMIICAAMEAAQFFRGLLVNKPSNECEGGPAERDRPCESDHASHT